MCLLRFLIAALRDLASLQPGESCVAHVIVKMDESMDFTDTLHVLIQEGADMAIPLTASGESEP